MIFTGYKFRGKHATYAKFLATERGSEREDGLNVFIRVLDVYMVSAVMGIMYGKRSQIDESNSDTSDIQAQAMIKEQEQLMYLYRLILLCDESSGLSEQEKISRAFKTDGDEDAVRKNLVLFNSYVLGGIEILYERFKDCYGNDSEIFDEILDFAQSFRTDL